MDQRLPTGARRLQSLSAKRAAPSESDLLADILAEFKQMRREIRNAMTLPLFHRCNSAEGHVASLKCWCAESSYIENVGDQYCVMVHARVH